MAASQQYVGAVMPFGVIIPIENRPYNAEVIVKRQDGTKGSYKLPFLIAHGVRFVAGQS